MNNWPWTFADSRKENEQVEGKWKGAKEKEGEIEEEEEQEKKEQEEEERVDGYAKRGGGLDVAQDVIDKGRHWRVRGTGESRWSTDGECRNETSLS